MVGNMCGGMISKMVRRVRPFLRRLLGKTKPYRVAAEVKKTLAAFHGIDRRVVTLTPSGPTRSNACGGAAGEGKAGLGVRSGTKPYPGNFCDSLS